MKNIGIIGAMNIEIEKLVEALNLNKKKGIKDIYIGTYKDKNIFLINGGIGKVNSALSTQYLIDKYKIDAIIHTGCAGSLDKSLSLLELVIVDTVTYHDFIPTRVMKEYVPEEGIMKASDELINKFILIIPNNIKYRIGKIATGDCFVTEEDYRDKIKTETGAICVDMESASIAHVAKVNNIPFINIRTISDFADGIDDFEKEASYQSSFLVKKYLDIL